MRLVYKAADTVKESQQQLHVLNMNSSNNSEKQASKSKDEL